MITLKALVACAALLAVASCAPGQVRQGLQVASDAKLIDDCAEFLQVERSLRGRIMDLSESDLNRLAEIDIDGTKICTLDVTDLTAELREMLGRLP